MRSRISFASNSAGHRGVDLCPATRQDPEFHLTVAQLIDQKWREQDRWGIAYLHDLALDLGLFDPPPKWPPENLVTGSPGGFIPRWLPTQEDSPEELNGVCMRRE